MNHTTVGVIGAGRIGAAFARMMAEGHKMNVLYYDLYPSRALEEQIAAYGEFLKSIGEEPVSCRRAETAEASTTPRSGPGQAARSPRPSPSIRGRASASPAVSLPVIRG